MMHRWILCWWFNCLRICGAEFLAQEFKDVSPWIGVGGYVMAAGTGYLRVYNDKHWFSEIATGAGIGILAGKLTYWLCPAIERKLGLHPAEACPF